MFRGSVLDLIDQPSTHSITAFDPIEKTPDRVFDRLLRMLISQAMHDGMTAIRFRHEDTEGKMEYFGPSNYDSPRWWDMVPPPIQVWNRIFRATVIRTHFGEKPGEGRLTCRFRRRLVEVRVSLLGAADFVLAWDAT